MKLKLYTGIHKNKDFKIKTIGHVTIIFSKMSSHHSTSRYFQ